MERYSRQISLPEIGSEGQQKLAEARVLIVGVGGLGSPIALYLAGAGIGTIGLIDDDSVSLNNLQRQVIYTEDEIGLSKTSCAARRLRRFNSSISIREHSCRLTPENAPEIIAQYDVVVDGCDNYSTRYLISDTCEALHIPYIYGAISPLGGQVAILCHGKNAVTYRQLFPEEEINHPPQKETIQQPTPVIGTTPAIIGSMQANETLKLIAGYGQPIINKLWTIDLLSLETNIISLEK